MFRTLRRSISSGRRCASSLAVCASNLRGLTAFAATFFVGLLSYASNSAAETPCEAQCLRNYENCLHSPLGVQTCEQALTRCLNLFCRRPPPPPPPGGDVLSSPKLMLKRAHVNVPVMGVIATFRDSNPSALVSDFTAVIDWGDGTQSDGVVTKPSPGVLDVSAASGGHTYGTRGRVTVSVSLSAPSVTESTATGTVQVRR
jgi:hypothetical protein